MKIGLNTSLLINSQITIMTIHESKDQKTSFKEPYMNLLLGYLFTADKCFINIEKLLSAYGNTCINICFRIGSVNSS